MPYMDIPYGLDDHFSVAEFRFKSIWKVQANDTYRVNQPNGFSIPGIFVTYEGKGTLAYADTRYELDTGTYMIVPQGTPCSYQCVDGDWKFYFIHFDPLDLVVQLELAVGKPVSSAKITEASRLCERLIDSLIVKPKGYGLSVQLVSQELLQHLAREHSASSQSRHPELDDILYQMHRNIGQPSPIDEFVRQSGLSRTVFFSRFRSRTGMSPNRYMQELKLASAKAALETTNSSVKEIAAALQFYDEFHFSKLFKTRYGVSPRAHRHSLVAAQEAAEREY